MIRYSIIIMLIALAIGGVAKSESPTPIIVKPANAFAPATATSSNPGAAAAPSNDAQTISAAIKVLEQIKAANDEVLAKQKAALERLDELQEAADQLQIFAKRS